MKKPKILKALARQKIAILGLGVENRALLDFLQTEGVKNLTVLDQHDSLRKKMGNLRAELGKNYLKSLDQFDIVFRTPGIPFRHPALEEARQRGVLISSQMDLFLRLCPAHTIGVTGTKGKGTTVTLIAECLRRAGRPVYLGGNIGIPPLHFLARLAPEDWVVLEFSSFQLEGLTLSPEIAVMLDITSDHLDYHKSQENYVEAKASLIRFQRAGDRAIFNADYLTTIELASQTHAQRYWFSRRKSVERGVFIRWGPPQGRGVDWGEFILRDGGKDQFLLRTYDLHLRGAHNLENIAAAALASHLAGVPLAAIRRAIHAFRGLPHRLELIAEKNGIRYYNDSLATNPSAVEAAISCFAEPVILIAGGRGKDVPYDSFGVFLARAKYLKAVVLLGENKNDLKEAIIRARGSSGIVLVASMEEAVAAAHRLARLGEVILLSPGAASFDMFRDYKDRGQAFRRAVEGLE